MVGQGKTVWSLERFYNRIALASLGLGEGEWGRNAGTYMLLQYIIFALGVSYAATIPRLNFLNVKNQFINNKNDHTWQGIYVCEY